MFKIAFLINFSTLITPPNSQLAAMRWVRQGEAQSFVEGMNWAWRMAGSRLSAVAVDAQVKLS